jgi:tetratricopeptide (TPR) repeat protein
MLELVVGENAVESVRWFQDGKLLASEFTLDGSSLRVLDEVRIAYQNLFSGHSLPFAKPEAIKALGAALYDLFFRPAESALSSLAAGPHTLLLHSQDWSFFNLPWELIHLPGSNLPLGCDPNWSLLRVSCSLSGSTLPPPDSGPLRLLFLAAAPEGDVPLDYEREEEVMLEATAHLVRNVVVLPFAETGGIDELADLVRRHRPHVVHLSGHGTVDPKGVAWFAFEDERGRSDPQPADEIANRVFRGSAVRCVVLNACRSGQAAAVGLAGRLVSAGIPAIVGWGAPVIDETATRFVGNFYRFLAAGERLAVAVARAREDIWRGCRRTTGQHESWDATFALPRVFVSTLNLDLIDWSAPPSKYEGPKTEMMLLGDEIKGLKEGFVGRRRDQQHLIPSLRDGASTVAVLTGLGGMGKSTLATRAASRLREAGFEVTGIKVLRAGTPAETGRLFLVEKLLPALALPFMVTEPALYKAITNGEFPVEHRVKVAAAEWNKRKLALVIDNFEDVLDAESRAISDPGLQQAYHILTRNLTGSSRLIVTCRYFPADTPEPTKTAHVLWRDLKDLKLFELVKFLRRDDRVEARLRHGAIGWPRIVRIHRVFGGTPGFLVQVRGLLGTADLDEWDEEAPEDTPLEEIRERYCERILLPKLYGLLPADSQALVSRLAVSELPLSVDGLAHLASLPESEPTATLAAGASYGLVQIFVEESKPTLYHVPGLIRGWLSAEARLSPDARRSVDAVCARFWKKSYESDREDELQVAIDVELLTCRTHAERAGLSDEAHWATSVLCQRLIDRSEWRAAREMLNGVPDSRRDGNTWHQLAAIDLNEGNYAEARKKFDKALTMQQAIGDRAGEAATWHQLAALDVYEENYAAARESFGKALAMQQAIGDRAGEANTWHNLATIDLREGMYAAAQEKFGKALAMRQAIGDRAGEAATWNQLGVLGWKKGTQAEAVQLVAVGFLLLQSVGHGNLQQAAANLSGMSGMLGSTEDQIRDMLNSVAASYQQDRGASLLKAAFPD